MYTQCFTQGIGSSLHLEVVAVEASSHLVLTGLPSGGVTAAAGLDNGEEESI
tara:strand:- start:276 stop:431 length:156 start_codon:yes stop_codon:yes gene_type:complete